MSKEPDCSRAARAPSKFPDFGLTNAGISEAFGTSTLRSVVRLPEPRKRGSVGRLTQLLESALADLADALAGHSHQCADLLESHCVGALLETVVQVKDLSLTRCQVLSEHLVDELLHQVEIGDFLDLGAIDAGESFTECARFAITAIDGGVERNLGCRHLLRGAHRFGSFFEEASDLMIGGIALQDLGENCLCAGKLDELGILI